MSYKKELDNLDNAWSIAKEGKLNKGNIIFQGNRYRNLIKRASEGGPKIPAEYGYTYTCKAGRYSAPNYFQLGWLIFKHRLWHLFKHGKWMD